MPESESRTENDRQPPAAQDTKRQIIRFVVLFLLQVLVFNVLFFLYIAPGKAFKLYLHLNALVSGWLLKLFGEDGIQVHGTLLSSNVSALEIKQGCDGIQALAIFLAAIIAFPAPGRQKLRGVILGGLFLVVANLVRILTLYYIATYKPDLFHAFHIEVWQPVFIMLALVLWFIWAQWVMKKQN